MKRAMLDMPSPVGNLRLCETDGSLAGVSYLNAPCAFAQETPLLRDAVRMLGEYFARSRRVFALPLALGEGTSFQRAVWETLLTIPYGETVSYGEIARRIGNPKAFRAVGMACHVNPIAIIVPCHRVIGTNGKLTGYAEGLMIKETLLKLEQEGIQNDAAY